MKIAIGVHYANGYYKALLMSHQHTNPIDQDARNAANWYAQGHHLPSATEQDLIRLE